jgi:uncharacterized protein DUF1064
MSRWSAADLARVSCNLKNAIATPLTPAPPKVRKYRNKPIVFQGLKFDSQHELQDWKNFELQRVAGAIRAVIRQVSLSLPGTTRRIRIDFLVIENTGRHRWFDSKGLETQTWRLKRDQVFDAYGLTIELI